MFTWTSYFVSLSRFICHDFFDMLPTICEFVHWNETSSWEYEYIHTYSSKHSSVSSDSFLVFQRELFAIFIFTWGFRQTNHKTNIIQTKSRSMLSARLRLWTWQYNILMFLDNFQPLSWCFLLQIKIDPIDFIPK